MSGHNARQFIEEGEKTGATPDGRRKGEEFSKNLSPTMGVDTEGVTALVQTLASLDSFDFPGDFPLDIMLLPYTVSGEKGLDMMKALIYQYFDNGGFVVQFNVFDVDELKQAQKNPQKFENLQVRVCGWNVRWNDLPKVEQDAYIRRAEAIAR
jgi:formate C-acetyltransferase